MKNEMIGNVSLDGNSAPTTPLTSMVNDERKWPAIVNILYLASVGTFGVTAVVGIIMAYMKSDTADEVAASHLRYAVWTFWYCIALLAICIPVAFLISSLLDLQIDTWSAGFYNFLRSLGDIKQVLSVPPFLMWITARAVRSLTQLSDNRQINNPRAFL